MRKFAEDVQRESLTLSLPEPSKADQNPNLTLLRIMSHLCRSAPELRRLSFIAEGGPNGKGPQPSPRSFGRAGFWLAMHEAGIEVLDDDSTTAKADADCWNLDEWLGEVQGNLFGNELQWRPTRAEDLGSRLEYQVGVLDRPDSRLASFGTADELAARISGEIVEIAAGGARRAQPDDARHFSRLIARAIATLVENIADHAYDYDCLPRETRETIGEREPLAALLVSLTRGGGSSRSRARQSANRIYIGIHDNGLSIPTTVRHRDRLGGLDDSASILKALLHNSLETPTRSHLRGLGYPELVDLAQSARLRGWKVALEVVTQVEDMPGDTIVATRTLDPRRGEKVDTRVSYVPKVPVIGTSVTLAISVPGKPDWLDQV